MRWKWKLNRKAKMVPSRFLILMLELFPCSVLPLFFFFFLIIIWVLGFVVCLLLMFCFVFSLYICMWYCVCEKDGIWVNLQLQCWDIYKYNIFGYLLIWIMECLFSKLNFWAWLRLRLRWENWLGSTRSFEGCLNFEMIHC